MCERKSDADAVHSNAAVRTRELQQLLACAFSQRIDRGEAKAYLAVANNRAQAVDQAGGDAFDRDQLCERPAVDDAYDSAAEPDERLGIDRWDEEVAAAGEGEDCASPGDFVR